MLKWHFYASTMMYLLVTLRNESWPSFLRYILGTKHSYNLKPYITSEALFSSDVAILQTLTYLLVMHL